MISIHSAPEQARSWLKRCAGKRPAFVAVLGFTATGLREGISAAGATPEDRKITALADAEFLVWGKNRNFVLPPLIGGVSPAVITRAVVTGLEIPILVFDAGLPRSPTVPHISLQGTAAACLSSGQALDRAIVAHLWQEGLTWGKKLALSYPWIVVSECVVGGTTTALAILTALGIVARNRISSSHPTCNHDQKWQLVQQGLQQATLTPDPLSIVAAVGDPMQVVVAGMALGASPTCGVLLAGGSQMLAVYALAQHLASFYQLPWHPEAIAVGTTPWVVHDPTSDVPGLAQDLHVPLLATTVSFQASAFAPLRAYEAGFVKEGLGAGAAAIVANLYGNWQPAQLLQKVEETMTEGSLQ